MGDALLRFVLLLAMLAPGAGEETSPGELVERYMRETVAVDRYDLRQRILGLGQEGADAAAQALRRKTDWPDRYLLVLLLADFQTDGVVKHLASVARRDDEYTCRYYAIHGLSDHGEAGVVALEGLLGSSDLPAADRSTAIDALARSRHPSAVAVLVRCLRREAKSELGARLVDELARARPEVAVAAFLGALSKSSTITLGEMVFLLGLLAPEMPDDLRRTVEGKIARSRRYLLADLDSDDRSERRAAARGLGALRDSAAVPELERLCEPPAYGIEDFVWALARIDAPGHRQLFERLVDRENGTASALDVSAALYGMAEIGGAPAAGTIARALEAGVDQVVIAAADALARLGAQEQAAAVAERLLRGGIGTATVSSLLLALESLGNPEVAYPLARFIRDDRNRKDDRQAALATLGALPGAAATRELTALAADRMLKPEERGILVAALAPRSGDGIVDFLIACAGHAEEAVRQETLAAARGAAVHVPELIDRLYGARPDEARTIRTILAATADDRALDPLLIAIEQDAARPRDLCRTIGLLEKLGHPGAVDRLAPFLDDSDPDISQAAASAALSLAGPLDPRVAPALAKLLPLWTEEARVPVATEALRLVGRAHHAGARATALWVLKHGQNAAARTQAAEALTGIGLDADSALEVLATLADEPGRVQLIKLEALLSARERSVDLKVMATGKKSNDPVLAAAVQFYALRCGCATTTSALAAGIEGLAPLFHRAAAATSLSLAGNGPPEDDSSARAHQLLEWLTGSDFLPDENLPEPVSPFQAGYFRTSRIVFPPVPVVWLVRRWIDEHEPELLEAAAFGAAVRAPNLNQLREYLRRYPEGRFAAEASHLVATGDTAK